MNKNIFGHEWDSHITTINPNLYPMKHLWNELKKRVNSKVKMNFDLVENLEENYFHNIDVVICQKEILIGSHHTL